jgi:hypothetical protein
MGMYGGGAPAPVTNNYQESMREALQAQIDLAPDLYQAEKGFAKNDDGEYEYVGGGRKEYAKLEGEIQREALTGTNGIASLLGGDAKYQFADGYRKAGYDAGGNFLGASKLEQDLMQRGKADNLQQDIALAQANQNSLTTALRGGSTGAMQQAINNFKAKANESSAPRGIEQKMGLHGTVDALKRDIGSISGYYDGQNDKIEADANIDPDVSADKLTAQNINAIPQVTSSPISGARQVLSQNVSNQSVGAEAIGDLGGLRSTLSSQAMSDLALGGNLSDGERRQIEQDARAAASARGRGRDVSAIVDEVANLESARRDRQNERRQFAQGIAGQEAQLRESDVGRNLQAGLANQQANLQSSLANQNSSLQAGLANQQMTMQTQLANQQASQRSQQANQSADLQRQQGNQQVKLQAGSMNQQANLQAQQIELQNRQVMKDRDLQAQGMEASRQAQINQMKQAGEVANIQTQMDLGRLKVSSRQNDLDRSIAIDQINNQMNMQAMGMDRAALQNLINIEQATSADAFMAITGKPSGQSMTSGQSAFGNASGALGAGPTLYNPAQGAEFMANQSAMLNSYNAATYGADQAMMGSIIGGIAGGAGAAAGGYLSRPACWVAREVYGINNPRWIMFRQWMLNISPFWFRAIYLNFGERFAKFIKNKPRLKARIRKWMDSKIQEGK